MKPSPSRIRRNVSLNSLTMANSVTTDLPRLETLLIAHAPITTLATCVMDKFPNEVLDKDAINCIMTPETPMESVDMVVDINEEEKKRRTT